MADKPPTDDDCSPPGATPFGFTFGVDDEGWPVAYTREGYSIGDVFAFWLFDNNEPADITEHLAGIDDVVAGRRPFYRAQYNDGVVLVEPSGFQVFLVLPSVPQTPHYVGSIEQLRLLLERWSQHMERIGWKGVP